MLTAWSPRLLLRGLHSKKRAETSLQMSHALAPLSRPAYVRQSRRMRGRASTWPIGLEAVATGDLSKQLALCRTPRFALLDIVRLQHSCKSTRSNAGTVLLTPKRSLWLALDSTVMSPRCMCGSSPRPSYLRPPSSKSHDYHGCLRTKSWTRPNTLDKLVI